MNPKDLVDILMTVPETRLRIIELTWELVDTDGKLDENRAVLRIQEIREACEEAEDYAAATRHMVWSLNGCLRTH